MRDSFKDVAANVNNPKWENMISRINPLYQRNNDLRSDFERDYTRVIHSRGYRRMKHKTQVFFSPENDHICTRIEHVALVESISYTIAKYLGLNVELTRAIATAHDIGHAPFGHQGERILSEISERDLGKTFWHERNGLEIVDNIELLDTPKGGLENLDLTYAVRDGIISHCGEIDENNLKPRDEFIDLDDYTTVNQYAPYTWEGCVVKIADKISYLGRDIADAVTLGLINDNLDELYEILGMDRVNKINNTIVTNDFIVDLCENSTPEKGFTFSEETFEKIKRLKEYNYKNIYFNHKTRIPNEYFKLVINTIYNLLKTAYTNREEAESICKLLVEDFDDYLINYWTKERPEHNTNKAIFNIDKEEDYLQAIIYYISGMTDNYAIKMFNKIINF